MLLNGNMAHTKAIRLVLKSAVVQGALTLGEMYYILGPILGKRADKFIMNFPQLLKDMKEDQRCRTQKCSK